MAADFAFELSSFIAIVVIDIDVRGIAQSAHCERWNFGRVGPLLNRTKGLAVVGLILREKELIVFGLRRQYNRRLS